ncbi:MAG: ChaN family lipoprotein [Bacteroidota bacterium]
MLLLLTFLASVTVADSTDMHIYTEGGEPVAIEAIVAAFGDADVVFIGETHDDSLAHVLQFELLQAAAAGSRPVTLSLEMFARDEQLVLDEYLAGTIRDRDLKLDTRIWNNYDSDYGPMVDFAKENRMPVVAANAPRRYVSLVGREGVGILDSLGAHVDPWLPPRPYPAASPAYEQAFMDIMAEMMHGMPPAQPNSVSADSAEATAAATPAAESAPPAHPPMPGLDRMLAAQNLWDATMGYSIASHLETAAEDALVLHLVGSFHVKNRLGTPEHLARYAPEARQLVVVVVPVDDPAAFDPDAHAGIGDFVVLTRTTSTP